MTSKIKQNKKPIMVVVVILIAVTAFFAGMSMHTATPETTAEHFIGLEKAQEIALDDIDVNKENAHILSADLKRDNGTAYYDMVFTVGNAKFDCAVDAQTGKVLETKREVPKQSEKKTMREEKNTTNSFMGVEKAKAIALEYARVSDAQFLEAHLDMDDGYKVYELEFISGDKEYEMDVDAMSGRVLDYDVEYVNEWDDDDRYDSWDD